MCSRNNDCATAQFLTWFVTHCPFLVKSFYWPFFHLNSSHEALNGAVNSELQRDLNELEAANLRITFRAVRNISCSE